MSLAHAVRAPLVRAYMAGEIPVGSPLRCIRRQLEECGRVLDLACQRVRVLRGRRRVCLQWHALGGEAGRWAGRRHHDGAAGKELSEATKRVARW
jgi:hypothetical protein